MEPEKYLPMNRAELITHAEAIAADLAETKRALAIVQDTSIAHAGKQNTRIRELEAALRESDEYLSGNPLNSIGAGSKLHRDMRRAWQGSESETFVKGSEPSG